MYVRYVTPDNKNTGSMALVKTTTFRQLKFIIADEWKKPSEKIVLYFDDILVKDDLTFKDYNMQSGDTVKVMFIPKDWVVKPKGLIEGIKVGTRWSKREHVAAAGVHTPLQQGISGDRIQGANSIVLSGGYEDNIDCGDIIYYTGCGGVTNGVQTSDQPWNNLNESLAINCGAKIDRTEGVLATDWNKCFPVRVVKKTSAARAKRKNKKNTENTEEYFVFIGIYRVCGCWPVRGKSRFRVWRFLLVKDNGDSNKVKVLNLC